MKQIIYVVGILYVFISTPILAKESTEKVDCSKETFYKEVKAEAIKRLARLSKDKIVHLDIGRVILSDSGNYPWIHPPLHDYYF